MLVPNQMVEVRWNGVTRKWYESLGYTYTKHNETFIVPAENLHPGSYALVYVECDYCGDIVSKTYKDFIVGRKKSIKDSCHNCAQLKALENRRERVKHKQWNKMAEYCGSKGYKILTDISEYVDSFTKVKYICPYHGVKESTVHSLERGLGCLECGILKSSEASRYSSDEVEEIVNSFNGNILLNKNEYVGTKVNNLKIKCGICGNVYITSFSVYRKGMKMCRQCSNAQSMMENIVCNVLKKYNIKFIPEKTFDDCRDVKPLPFDFYLHDLNCLIETHGIQHYQPVDHFGGEDKFEIQKKHDLIKKMYCEEHNIKLIEIPYWRKDDIEKILICELKLDLFIAS